MDRFIVLEYQPHYTELSHLKSNMDRFIVVLITALQPLRPKFKIQYG